MPLPTKSFNDLVNDQANAMQGVADKILDFSEGSINLAEIESNAGNSLWLQSLVVSLLAFARLATSQGIGVDSFVNDFDLFRDPATPTFGPVTFYRATPNKEAIISAGTLDLEEIGSEVSSSGSGIIYSVYADPDNPNYNPDLNAYIIPIGINSAVIPVVSETPGTIGNVLANQIDTIYSIIPYVDSVTNAAPISNGVDEETDEALKIRFPLYLNSLSKATKQALQAAILGVPGIVRYKLQENENLDESKHLGFFYAVVDDGSGGASAPLLASVQAVLNATRGFTIAYSAYAPTPITINIVSNIVTTGASADADVRNNVINSLMKFISSSAFDALIPYSKIAEIIYDADSTILNLTSWTLNGGTTDIQLSGQQVGVPGIIVVNIS